MVYVVSFLMFLIMALYLALAKIGLFVSSSFNAVLIACFCAGVAVSVREVSTVPNTSSAALKSLLFGESVFLVSVGIAR